MNAANPISAAAESGFRQAARLLGASHGAARLTPYVADDRPEGDYSRTVTGYTSYLAWEDGVNLLMAALGVRVPEADEGPWFDACWRVAHDYIDAYDSAAQAQPSDPAPAPTPARTSPWPNRSPSSSTFPDPTAASTSPRTATAT